MTHDRRVDDPRIIRMEADIEHIKETQAKMDEKLDKFIESANTKYASKYVEKAFWWGLATVGTVFIGSMFTLLKAFS